MWAIDVPCLDINVNHFKSKCDAENYCYDSSDKNGDYYKTPWNLEKVEANIGLGIGPSYTVAPFVALHNEQLDYIKVNVYWHIGFGGSFIFMSNDKDKDRNNDEENQDHVKMASAVGSRSIQFVRRKPPLEDGGSGIRVSHQLCRIQALQYGELWQGQDKVQERNKQVLHHFPLLIPNPTTAVSYIINKVEKYI